MFGNQWIQSYFRRAWYRWFADGKLHKKGRRKGQRWSIGSYLIKAE
jgi:hypothetical protein